MNIQLNYFIAIVSYKKKLYFFLFSYSLIAYYLAFEIVFFITKIYLSFHTCHVENPQFTTIFRYYTNIYTYLSKTLNNVKLNSSPKKLRRMLE